MVYSSCIPSEHMTKEHFPPVGHPAYFPFRNGKYGNERHLSEYASNQKERKSSSTHAIELSVFVDKKLFEILKETFPRNAKQSVSNYVLAIVDMVSKLIVVTNIFYLYQHFHFIRR